MPFLPNIPLHFIPPQGKVLRRKLKNAEENIVVCRENIPYVEIPFEYFERPVAFMAKILVLSFMNSLGFVAL